MDDDAGAPGDAATDDAAEDVGDIADRDVAGDAGQVTWLQSRLDLTPDLAAATSAVSPRDMAALAAETADGGSGSIG